MREQGRKLDFFDLLFLSHRRIFYQGILRRSRQAGQPAKMQARPAFYALPQPAVKRPSYYNRFWRAAQRKTGRRGFIDEICEICYI